MVHAKFFSHWTVKVQRHRIHTVVEDVKHGDVTGRRYLYIVWLVVLSIVMVNAPVRPDIHVGHETRNVPTKRSTRGFIFSVHRDKKAHRHALVWCTQRGLVLLKWVFFSANCLLVQIKFLSCCSGLFPGELHHKLG
jgi:hypothetical protein